MRKSMKLPLVIGFSLILLPACGHFSKENKKSVQVDLESKSGSDVNGEVVFVQTQDGLKVEGQVTGLEPNTQHGMHIHEVGDCSAKDATSAGGHFAPQSNPHGSPDEEQHHLGDLGNISANSDGVATFSILVDEATIENDQKNSFLNRALIVHKGKDDLESQPSGDSGPRIACAVIK